MGEAPRPEGVDPALVSYLRRLVTALTLTMIAGLLVLIALVVIRFRDAPGPVLPEALALPDGAAAVAVTQGRGWFAVVTDDDRILLYDAATGALTQTVQVER